MNRTSVSNQTHGFIPKTGTGKPLNLMFTLSLLFSSLFLWQACAQPLENRKTISNQGITPVMKITNLKNGETNPMKIDVLKIDIKVIGQIAVTTMEFTYLNTNPRVMEGEFNFPLAEGQTVTRFALDINGQMREGVVVEKELGRKTFEAIVRRGVDPGLLEKTEGNNFRARVYPLPANGNRKIIIAYEQELTARENGDLYLLPLHINESIGEFWVHAEVIRQKVKTNIDENELSNFQFKEWDEAYLADFAEKNYIPSRQIAFMIPNNNQNFKVYTEAIKEGYDSYYFYSSIKPQKIMREKVLPAKIALYWDNSGSCSARDIATELEILDGYIQKIGNLQVELVPFNIVTEKSKVFTIANGKWDALKEHLTDMTYDGGTSFGKIDFKKVVCDEILLFSDGLSNFGSSSPSFSNTPVVVCNSNPVANHSFLLFLAQQSGGQYLNLAKLSVNEAIGSLTRQDYHFISAKVVEGDIDEMYPAIPSPFQNSFSLAGILKGKAAVVELNFGFGNTIVYTEKVNITGQKQSSSGIVRRAWARKKLESLQVNEEANKEAITSLGKEFGIVTANTSLIVLENVSDYIQYKIVPPKEMQAEYFQFVNERERSIKISSLSRVSYLVDLFNNRVIWWNTNYPLKPVVKGKPQSRSLYSSTSVVDSIVEESDKAFIVVEESANFESVVSSPPPAEISKLEETVVIGYGTSNSGVLSGRVSGVNVTNAGLEKKDNAQNKPESSASIQLNAWDPQTPYLKVLQYAAKGEGYATYLKLKKEYGSIPFFYIDASDFFAKTGNTGLAVKVLSNLAELKLEEPQLLRILGKKLLTLAHAPEAVDVYKKVLKLKGEEPQSYRDLGLAYAANSQYQLAINTLYEIVKREWDGRFPEIELIVIEELNNIVASQKAKLDISFIDPRLIKNMPVDIRVVLTWDTDNCDMDLWVTDPSGEKCFYGQNITRIGGLISRDFTQGYGPEEFLLKKAISGEYIVQANYYGTNVQNTLAPVTLHLAFYTNYGKPNQKKQQTTLRLENNKDVIDIGKFRFSTEVK